MDPRNNVTSEEARRIEELTRDQATSYKWKEERHWRLTASRFGDICRATERRNLPSLAKSILNPPHLTGAAVSYGKAQEANAIKKFMEVTKLEVTKCGLFVDVDNGFLAGTPDGLIGEETLVEVKCPYRGREHKITPDPDEFPFLEYREGQLKLKKLHPYMYQVQGQMAVCKREQSYFVTFTLCDLHYELIKFDSEFYQQEMFPCLQHFFTEHYKPAIVKELVKDSSDMEY